MEINKCPKCGSRRVKAMAYGLIHFSIKFLFSNKIRGGCHIKPDSPAWYCARCKNRWGNINEERNKNETRL